MICMFKTIYYCYQMYLKTFEICLEIHQCDIAPFFNAPGLAWQAAIKRTKVK